VLEASVEVERREFTVAAALRVAPGERLALFGPSGSGKTTILEMIAGLVPPRRGQVVLAGRVLTRTAAPRVAVPPWRRRVGLLRQDPGLFPHLTVRQNLEYGAGPHPDPGPTAALASQLGIGALLGDRPGRLSGGQAHRVALGRLLLACCDALLLDEPYAGLDAELRRVLTGLVRSLAAERGVPTVLVAHELADAQAFADRLAVLDRGRLLHTGPAGEVVRRPASRRVAELVGYRAFVPLVGAAADHDAVRRYPRPYVAPQTGDDLAPQAGDDLAPQAGHGLAAQAGHGLAAQAGHGLAPQAGHGLAAQAGHGLAPQAGHGLVPQAGHGLAPLSGVPGEGAVGGVGAEDVVAGVHPERVVAGAQPERGLVLTGRVEICHPAGAGWEAEIGVGGVAIWCRLPDPPARDVTVTVLDPPCFGPGGALLPPSVRVRA
jgi:ABC-type sulfate/molybdate transport systems ATPase subunit